MGTPQLIGLADRFWHLQSIHHCQCNVVHVDLQYNLGVPAVSSPCSRQEQYWSCKGSAFAQASGRRNNRYHQQSRWGGWWLRWETRPEPIGLEMGKYTACSPKYFVCKSSDWAYGCAPAAEKWIIRITPGFFAHASAMRRGASMLIYSKSERFLRFLRGPNKLTTTLEFCIVQAIMSLLSKFMSGMTRFWPGDWQTLSSLTSSSNWYLSLRRSVLVALGKN